MGNHLAIVKIMFVPYRTPQRAIPTASATSQGDKLIVSTETLEFVGGAGHRLAGVLHRPTDLAPNERARGCVLMAHCFTCSKDLHTMTRLAKGLADAGYAAMRFDFTGRGESGGDFKDKTLSANVSDLVRAATHLVQMGFGPCGLIGHSLGGAAAVLAAHRLKTVRSLVTMAAPSDASHVRHLFSSDTEVNIGGRVFEIEPTFISDLVQHDVLSRASQLARPYLTVHAQDDTIVSFDNGQLLHAAATHTKRLYAPKTGGHLFAPRSAAEAALTEIVAWFNETL